MEYLGDLKEYCDQGTIDSIIAGYTKIVGIESNLDIINENNKYVGTILLINNAPRLKLNMIVEFNTDKIKWRSNKFNEDFRFYLVDPYWIKSYAPSPKIKVPIKVLDVKSDQIVVEFVELTFKQFMKNRLFDFYGGFQYKYVAAYDNFSRLFKNNQYYFAINSTVKHYKVSQKNLVKVLSLIDNEKKRIKTEWNSHMNSYFQFNQASKMIEELYGKESRKNNRNNVIAFKK
jgi:hypothetical protein